MPHPLEIEYDLTATELLDAIDRRFRLKVALEGAVAEVHFERKLKVATQEGWLRDYVAHDTDGLHDYTVTTLAGTMIRVEVKSIRRGQPRVELQKTRVSQRDPSTRLYSRDQFDVVAVCMGKNSGIWSEFRYGMVSDLAGHRNYPDKLKVMHKVVDDASGERWFGQFQEVIDAFDGD